MQPETETGSEASTDPEIDLILTHWRPVAAAAWEGYQTRGRGAVVLTLRERATFAYRSGPPCFCHADFVRRYDPSADVIVVLRCRRGESVHHVGGWPSPPAAWVEAGADIFDATIR